MNTVFVFGSNLAGIHGAGAALYAAEHYGAQRGVGRGPTGNAYALPTKDHNIKTLPLEQIHWFVEEFLDYAARKSDSNFLVTAVGCGLAGYRPQKIAWMFANGPQNVYVSTRFVKRKTE